MIEFHVKRTNSQNESIFILFCFFTLFLILGQEHLLDVWIVPILLSTSHYVGKKLYLRFCYSGPAG